MKNLELKNYGVQELSTTEMKNVNGGIWAALILLAVAVAIDFFSDGEVNGHI